MKKNIFTISIFILFFINCQKKEKTYFIEYRNDIKIINNIKPKFNNPILKLEFIKRIGEVNHHDHNYLLFEPLDVITDDKDNIYILDSGNHRIQKYNSEGVYLLSIGHKGQGPGEFITPSKMNINNDYIYVSDPSNRRIQTFDKIGNYSNNIPLKYNIRNFIILKSKTMISPFSHNVFREPKSVSEKLDSVLIGIYDLHGNLLKTFGNVKDFGERSANFDGNRISLVSDANDDIYVSYTCQNKIEKYSSAGKLKFRISRTLNYDLEPQKIERIIGDRKYNFILLPFITRGIGIDHKGNIWIETIKDQGAVGDPKKLKNINYIEFDIFNSKGVSLNQMSNPVHHTHMRIIGDRLYLIDTGVNMCVYEYKISYF